jgi:hypothetical protein
MVLALTQSGKTGVILATIGEYIKKNVIPEKNIYIITGLSSTAWLEQTRERFPEIFHKRIYHRNMFKKFLEDVKDKKNVIVFIDEIQIAAQKDQTIYNTLKEIGFLDKKNLCDNDIKIVHLTATPDGVKKDIDDWGDNARVIVMESGEGYTSVFDLQKQNRVYQYKDLFHKDNKIALENISELKKIIDERFKTPKYHIIRFPGGNNDKKYENLKKVFINSRFHKYDEKNLYKKDDLYNLLDRQPNNHEFIVIKEKMRCSETLNKKHLGVLHERHVNGVANDSVIIQGLLGRATGYGDTGETIVFTNIHSIEKYKKLWDSKFNNEKINKWISRTTNKSTYAVSPEKSRNKQEKNQSEPIIKICQTWEDVMKYFKDNIKPFYPKKTGPRKKQTNENGFYENSIRKKKKVYSRVELEVDYKWGLTKNDYRVHACYQDIKDASTLEFWYVHYPVPTKEKKQHVIIPIPKKC